MIVKCGFVWTVPDPIPPYSGGYRLIHLKCIRRKGHPGNHVSYPSGEEHYNDPDDDAHAGIPASEHAERNRTSLDD